MTNQSGGGGGIPGVTSDGQTPGGEIVAGQLTAGDASAALLPSAHRLTGFTAFTDSQGNVVDGDVVVAVGQSQPLPVSGYGAAALDIRRSGSVASKNYDEPTLWLRDSVGSNQPVIRVEWNNAMQFQVDSDGIRVHGKFKTGASVAHVLGAYSGNAVPIYNEAGTLLGYMPLYA